MSEVEGPTVAQLVVAAAGGDRAAWNEIVERFTPLVLATARRYRLADHDAADVAQTVWLRLIEHLGGLREPAALPGWLVSTTRHECVRSTARRNRMGLFDPLTAVAPSDETIDVAADVADGIDRSSRHQAMLAGFAELSASDRALLQLLINDPPFTYAEISVRLHIPIGSIGPTRGRALERLRATVAVSQLVDSEN